MEFNLKTITFFGREVAIVCQNENGPCPLIAIANVLLLQNKIVVSPDRSFISLDELTLTIANHILERTQHGTAEVSAAYHSLIDSVFNILPKLAKGLDLNVIFSDVNKFEFTEEISVFDSLNIPLMHGWLYDVDDVETVSVVGNLSYNHLLFKMVDYKTLCDSKNCENNGYNDTRMVAVPPASGEEVEVILPGLPGTGSADVGTPNGSESTAVAEAPIPETSSPTLAVSSGSDDNQNDKESEGEGIKKEEGGNEEATIFREGRIIERFLNKTASQLTYQGMLKIYSFMKDRELAVLFRNNHFSTLFFNQGQLFILVTDLGYLHEPNVVWELLNEIHGDSDYCNGAFQPLSSLESESSSAASMHNFAASNMSNTVGTMSNTAIAAGTFATPPKSSVDNTTSTKVEMPRESSVIDGKTQGIDNGGSSLSSPTQAQTQASAPVSVLASAVEESYFEMVEAPTSPHALTGNATGCVAPVQDEKGESEVQDVRGEGEIANPLISTAQGAPVSSQSQEKEKEKEKELEEEIDTDLLLAMQLQRQEDEELLRHQQQQQQSVPRPPHPSAAAGTATGTGTGTATGTATGTGTTNATSSSSTNSQSRGDDNGIMLGSLSQEERDQQHALMLHYQESRQYQQQQHMTYQQQQQLLHQTPRLRPQPGQQQHQQQQRYTTYAASNSSAFPYNTSSSGGGGSSSNRAREASSSSSTGSTCTVS